jgi:hypothetical protein
MVKFRIIFAVVFIAIVVMIGFRIMMVSRALSNGKAIYEITITGNERGEVHLATEIIKQENGCIFFRDEFNREQTICGNYSVTKY